MPGVKGKDERPGTASPDECFVVITEAGASESALSKGLQETGDNSACVRAFKVEAYLHKYHWSLPTGTQKPPCEASLFSLMTLHLGDITATVIYAAPIVNSFSGRNNSLSMSSVGRDTRGIFMFLKPRYMQMNTMKQR